MGYFFSQFYYFEIYKSRSVGLFFVWNVIQYLAHLPWCLPPISVNRETKTLVLFKRFLFDTPFVVFAFSLTSGDKRSTTDNNLFSCAKPPDNSTLDQQYTDF